VTSNGTGPVGGQAIPASAVRLGGTVVLLCLLLAIGAVVVPATATAGSTTPAVTSSVNNTTDTAPPDPPSDRLGWENGVWYNESLHIDQRDGINDSELDAVVARTMARLEHVRGLEFDRTPPVRVISPDRQQNETAEQYADVNETSRIALNTQYESLLLINETTDAVESQQALFGGGVSGYYQPSDENITLISPDEDVRRVQEGVLAQELFHAQQDQYFGIDTNTSTVEARNARNGIVEGDANYVQYLYEQRCDGAWNGTCLRPNAGEEGSQEQPPNLNIGMVQLFLQPYNSGIAFVRERHQTGGWDAVDAVYDQPPASTEQTIHPDKYPTDEPTNLTVPDRSGEGWQPLRQNGERVTGSVGEAGLFVSLWMPSFESRGQRGIIPYRAHVNYNLTTREPAEPVTYSYDHPITAGWDGDKLVPYVANGSNETGYVYETAWDSEADAREFREGYLELLSYHGAEPVDGRTDTFRIDEGNEFADAFAVTRNGSRVTIVNAPTVEDLSAVQRGAGATTNETSGGTNTTETSDGFGPGFGIVGPVVALLAVVVGRLSRGRRS
jgi:hypothetical protein